MNILITGASRGLGKAMANILMEKGHNVLMPPRSMLDVTQLHSALKYSAFLARSGIALDVLVNNAGGLCDGFEDTMDLNARGPYLMTRELWPLLTKAHGRVINISSREGLSGDSFGYRPYSVAKGALNAVTRMQARNNEAIAINACCPGPFKSDSPDECRKAADTPIWMALEMDRSITGKFFINREVVPW